ncbi:carboxypeptidase-like regulatory domain-containing protein [Flavobacterium palustre]
MSLPGVSVLVSGSNKGTITDIDGKYELRNVDPKSNFNF